MQAGALTQEALGIIQNRGQPALGQACRTILQTPYDEGVVCEALHFYAGEVLPGVLPIFPAIIQLSSDVAGRPTRNIDPVAAAMLLITASGDVHDDIVDNSKGKFGKKTLYGKYGKETALLAGDLLLTQGFTALTAASKDLPAEQQLKIVSLVNSAMVEIVGAESLELALWRKKQVTPEEFFEVIRLKAGVAELHCRIGGLLADADPSILSALASCGRTIGILSTLKEEFVDLNNPLELTHRLRYELPPYPLLCAMHDSEVKVEISRVIAKGVRHGDVCGLIELVLGCETVGRVLAEFRDLGRRELGVNSVFKGERGGELSLLVEALSSELPIV